VAKSKKREEAHLQKKKKIISTRPDPTFASPLFKVGNPKSETKKRNGTRSLSP